MGPGPTLALGLAWVGLDLGLDPAWAWGGLGPRPPRARLGCPTWVGPALGLWGAWKRVWLGRPSWAWARLGPQAWLGRRLTWACPAWAWAGLASLCSGSARVSHLGGARLGREGGLEPGLAGALLGPGPTWALGLAWAGADLGLEPTGARARRMPGLVQGWGGIVSQCVKHQAPQINKGSKMAPLTARNLNFAIQTGPFIYFGGTKIKINNPLPPNK